MAVRIVRLGSRRGSGEGLRIGTVRRPPRGVRRSDYAKGGWYDVWFPLLAPSTEAVAMAHAARDERARARYVRRYRAEMRRPDASRALDLLAALSHHADFAVGCYCADESRCHRSILKQLLRDHGAQVR